VDNVGKTAETMRILLGISCGASASLPVDIPIYQGFYCPKPVCRKFLANYFSAWPIGQFLVALQ